MSKGKPLDFLINCADSTPHPTRPLSFVFLFHHRSFEYFPPVAGTMRYLCVYWILFCTTNLTQLDRITLQSKHRDRALVGKISKYSRVRPNAVFSKIIIIIISLSLALMMINHRNSSRSKLYEDFSISTLGCDRNICC